MIEIPKKVYNFLRDQHFVIISTIDSEGFVHTSCKGIVDIREEGRIYLLDLYRRNTYQNLKNNHSVSLTAVDEQRFEGYSIKGRGKALNINQEHGDLLRSWDKKLLGRMSKRVISHIRKDKSSLHHPELEMPHPEYIIFVEVEGIVDLSPPPR